MYKHENGLQWLTYDKTHPLSREAPYRTIISYSTYRVATETYDIKIYYTIAIYREGNFHYDNTIRVCSTTFYNTNSTRYREE